MEQVMAANGLTAGGPGGAGAGTAEQAQKQKEQQEYVNCGRRRHQSLYVDERAYGEKTCVYVCVARRAKRGGRGGRYNHTIVAHANVYALSPASYDKIRS